MVRLLLQKLFLGSLFLLCFWSASAQQGNPYITSYPLVEMANREVYAIEQGTDNLMFFATRKGVLIFDSEEWILIPMQNIPLALKYDSASKRTYVGALDEIGYIEKDDKGVLDYHSLSNGLNSQGKHNKIVIAGGYIWVLGDLTLTRFSEADNSYDRQWETNVNAPFTGLIQMNNEVYVNIADKGLFKADHQNLTTISESSLLKNNEILISIPLDNQKVMLGLSNGKLYNFTAGNISQFHLQDSAYLNESMLIEGMSLADGQIALSTLLGGCMIINGNTGKTVNILNINSGLPDDEIYSIGTDNSDGLWMAHQYGISRVALGSPVKNFTNYPGLAGKLVYASELGNVVYIATNEGVFYLNKLEEFKTTEIIIREKPVKNPKSQVLPPGNVKKETAESNLKKPVTPDTTSIKQPAKPLSKRELRRLEREKKKQAETATVPPEEGTIMTKIFGSFETKNEEKPPVITVKKKKIYSLQSVRYQFEKVKGLSEKCKLLLPLGNCLLVATNSGLFEIQNKEVSTVLPNDYITFITPAVDSTIIFVGTTRGMYSMKLTNGKWTVFHFFAELNTPVHAAATTRKDEIWLGGENFIYKLSLNADGTPGKINPFYIHTMYSEPLMIKFINRELFVFLSTGIFRFTGDSLQAYNVVSGPLTSNPSYIFSENNIVWANINNDWFCLADSGVFDSKQLPYLHMFEGIQQLYLDGKRNLWVIDLNNNLARIRSLEANETNQTFGLVTKRIANDAGTIFTVNNFEVDYENSSIEFKVIAPFYLRPGAVQYQYIINGLTREWSRWSSSSHIEFPLIPPGKYELRIRARNMLGIISHEKMIRFTVNPPFYRKPWFLAICAVLMAGLVLLFIRWRMRALQVQNRILEEKVIARTAEIEQQKEEIEAQRDEIEAQKNEMEDQRDKIAMQNKEITDSIVYAKRIQTAVMPSESEVRSLLPDSFVYFKPRNIVSGDFYWLTRKKDKTIVVAADCTGHGVPGAFMSMLGISSLNEIVSDKELPRANDILNDLRQGLKSTFSQRVEQFDVQDGMDIALLIIDHTAMQVEFAGAFNPLILIRNGDLKEYSADRMPIGSHVNERENFRSHFIEIQKNDLLYIFSDGYLSQFGGENDRKFNSKAFRQLLLSIHSRPLQEQKEYLNTTMISWMGDREQVDDMLVIGIRV